VQDNVHIVASLLQVDEKKVKSNPLYNFIATWYGVPYSYGSCSRKGVDCSCFVNLVYQEVFHLSLPRSSGEMFEKCKKISKKNLTEGDLVFFNTSGKKSSHVGIYLKNDKFVHASSKKGVMISSLSEEYFHKSFCGACQKDNIR
jgi:lipoprotein Spr